MVDKPCADGGLRELALFAGAGGGILGGHMLGWRTVCAVEREPYAASVLVARQKAFPKGILRAVYEQKEFAGSSQRPRHNEQRTIELDDSLRELSQHLALGGQEGAWQLMIEWNAYQQPMLVRHTSEKESGFWATLIF